MLTLTGHKDLDDNAFRDIAAEVVDIIKLNTDNGMTPHPALIGWLSLAPPPENQQSITNSRTARYNLQHIFTNGFIQCYQRGVARWHVRARPRNHAASSYSPLSGARCTSDPYSILLRGPGWSCSRHTEV